MHDVLITGSTGIIGRALINELLSREDGRLFLLIRGRDGLSAENRAARLLSEAGLASHLGRRVQVLPGDVTEPACGLTAEHARELRRRVGVFYHVAAVTELNGGRETCERVNLGGTLEALKLARMLRETGRLERFVYFSTAYCPGSLQHYHSLEDVLPGQPAFANHYEWSKYEAEARVRMAITEGLPATILRPSIVVGHSETGEISAFKGGPYPFMRLFAAGIPKRLVARLESTLNLVPIDFVAKATLAIVGRDDAAGRSFHLVSRTPLTIGMFLELKDRHYPTAPPIELVPPEGVDDRTMGLSERIALEGMKPFLSYLAYTHTFDTRNTEAALRGTRVSFPRTDGDFLDVLTTYAARRGYLPRRGSPSRVGSDTSARDSRPRNRMPRRAD